MKVSNNLTNALKGTESSKLNKASDSVAKDISSNDVKGAKTSNVDISNKAQMMNKAKTIASEQSVNQEKVDRLQKLIDNGKYIMDSASIADRLVDEHMLMGE